MAAAKVSGRCCLLLSAVADDASYHSAFSSFPDTSLFTEGSIQFSFKIRHVPPDPSSLAFPEPPSPQPKTGNEPVLVKQHARKSSVHRDRAAEYRTWDERGREWLYGFVWFQQRRDRGIARGFMQVSHGRARLANANDRFRNQLSFSPTSPSPHCSRKYSHASHRASSSTVTAHSR